VATVETRSTVRAEARYVRAAPRKAGLIVDLIRGRPVPEARTILAFMTRDAARDVRKVLDSAVANAETNHGLVGDDLVVARAFVGAGPVLKRWRARARGRVGRIHKRTCHITIELAFPGGEEIPAAIERPAPAPLEPAEPVAEEEAPAEDAAPAEEKPKRKRAAKPKAESDETATTNEPKAKPQAKPRASRAKKTTEEGEGS
jgi:large subunit ribosomal protein L22